MTGDVVWTSASFTGAGTVTGTSTIQANAVESAMIAENNITAREIAANAVVGAAIAANSIDSSELVTGSIDTIHIGASQVTTAKIADNAITAAKLPSGVISSDHITDGTIAAGDLAANSVDSAELITGSIDTIHLGASQVTTAKIADNAITSAKIAANQVGASEIAQNSVTTTQIASGITLEGTTTLSGTLDGNGNKVLFANVYSSEGDLPSASTYHGMFAHVHGTGKGYFGHAGNWIALANESAVLALTGGTLTGTLNGTSLVLSGNITATSANVSVATLETTGHVTLGNGTGDLVKVAGLVGIQDTNPPQKLHIDEVGGFDVATLTSNSTGQQTVDQFAAATFRTAKYLISITNSTDGDYQALELLLFHDGTTVYLTQYASIFDNGAQVTFDADINSGNVRLRATPASTDNITIKVMRQAIEV
jgi:hypothetical protein